MDGLSIGDKVKIKGDARIATIIGFLDEKICIKYPNGNLYNSIHKNWIVKL